MRILYIPQTAKITEKNLINHIKCFLYDIYIILRNFSKTPVCAIKMTDDIDSGPIYLKKKISLEGNLKEIFIRISNEINIMIRILKNKRVKPKKQSGKVFYFKINSCVNFNCVTFD